MTTLRVITNRMELAFWDITIQLMSESQWLHDAIRSLHEISRDKFQHPIVRYGAVFAVAGLLFGFIVGLLSG